MTAAPQTEQRSPLPRLDLLLARAIAKVAVGRSVLPQAGNLALSGFWFFGGNPRLTAAAQFWLNNDRCRLYRPSHCSRLV